MRIPLTDIEYTALWFYSGLELPEGYTVDLDTLPRARKKLEREKLVAPDRTMSYIKATNLGLERLAEGND